MTKFKALSANTMNVPPTYRAASALAMGVALEEALKLSTVTGTESAIDSDNVRAQFENVNVDSFYGKLAFNANGQIEIESLNGKPMYTQQWGTGGTLYTVAGPAATLTGSYVYPMVYKAAGSLDLTKLMVLDIESRIEVTMQEMRALLEAEHTSYAAGNKCVGSGNFLDYYNAQDQLGDGCSSTCAAVATSLTKANSGSNLPLNIVNSNWKDGNNQVIRVNFADSAVRFSQKTTVCSTKTLSAQTPDMDKQNEGTCLGDKVTNRFKLNYQNVGFVRRFCSSEARAKRERTPAATGCDTHRDLARMRPSPCSSSHTWNSLARPRPRSGFRSLLIRTLASPRSIPLASTARTTSRACARGTLPPRPVPRTSSSSSTPRARCPRLLGCRSQRKASRP